MAGESLIIDPLTEDTANVQLDVSDGISFRLISHDYPAPSLRTQYAVSADTDGGIPVDLSYDNRQIAVKVRVYGSSAADLETQLGYLFQKLGKINREGGTLKRTSPAGTVIVFDLLPEASGGVTFDNRYIAHNRAEVDIHFVAPPAWRGAPITLTSHAETTLPYLSFTETAIKGDLPGLGKLVITEAQGQSQMFVCWGIQSRYYDSASSATLFYEAESRTPQGGAATAAGPTGASGSGNNTVLQGNLTPTYQSMLSTQASGGGAHLSHVGDFQVFARVQASNAGTVGIRLDWADGDFSRHTLNAEVTFDSLWSGKWRLINLGQVHLAKVTQGTQRWEGRVLAKSTVTGDDLWIDYLLLVPIGEGGGQVRGLIPYQNPTNFSGRDEFDQTVGNLDGKTAPVGGTWATTTASGGSSTDITVETSGHTATRTASDFGLNFYQGRVAILGSTTFTDAAAQIDMKAATAFPWSGVVLRYIDADNYLVALDIGLELRVYKRVAGVITILTDVGTGSAGSIVPDKQANWVTQRFLCDAAGRFAVWQYLRGSASGAPLVVGYDTALATGGALASGKSGFLDYGGAARTVASNYDNYSAFVPDPDAAVFASRSLEIRHDRVIRADSGGTIWQAVSKYEGDYLFIPPAGREGRTVRMIVKACRNDPDSGADIAIDDISGRLTYTPRGLVSPEP